ncbi:hypothetical protein [Vibrio campbellii]|uniref:hypothetical protein n=1 Tax=Vibrio campbellii TaxID=680 RepID=UPI0005EE0D04|nr:hypothetical protein [Vibrio campbellii]
MNKQEFIRKHGDLTGRQMNQDAGLVTAVNNRSVVIENDNEQPILTQQQKEKSTMQTKQQSETKFLSEAQRALILSGGVGASLSRDGSYVAISDGNLSHYDNNVRAMGTSDAGSVGLIAPKYQPIVIADLPSRSPLAFGFSVYETGASNETVIPVVFPDGSSKAITIPNAYQFVPLEDVTYEMSQQTDVDLLLPSMGRNALHSSMTNAALAAIAADSSIQSVTGGLTAANMVKAVEKLRANGVRAPKFVVSADIESALMLSAWGNSTVIAGDKVLNQFDYIVDEAAPAGYCVAVEPSMVIVVNHPAQHYVKRDAKTACIEQYIAAGTGIAVVDASKYAVKVAA